LFRNRDDGDRTRTPGSPDRFDFSAKSTGPPTALHHRPSGTETPSGVGVHSTRMSLMESLIHDLRVSRQLTVQPPRACRRRPHQRRSLVQAQTLGTIALHSKVAIAMARFRAAVEKFWPGEDVTTSRSNGSEYLLSSPGAMTIVGVPADVRGVTSPLNRSRKSTSRSRRARITRVCADPHARQCRHCTQHRTQRTAHTGLGSADDSTGCRHRFRQPKNGQRSATRVWQGFKPAIARGRSGHGCRTEHRRRDEHAALRSWLWSKL
jgi:hypothetical protein